MTLIFSVTPPRFTHLFPFPPKHKFLGRTSLLYQAVIHHFLYRLIRSSDIDVTRLLGAKTGEKWFGAISGDKTDDVTPPTCILILFHGMTSCMMSAVVLLQTLARRNQTVLLCAFF
jgi:hypothetical protein